MFARTDRLLLRPGWAEDAPALYEAIADEAIVRNLASAPWPYRLSDAEAFLATQRPHSLPSFLLYRRTRGAPQLVGSAGLGLRADGEVELGYWIGRAFWGLDYATEAGEAVLGIARHALRLRKISAGHFVDNPASGRVLEKLGFAATGRYEQRYSAGRGASASSKLFELELGAEEVVVSDPPISFEQAFCMAA